MKLRTAALVMSVMACGVLGSCGKTGDLYIPEKAGEVVTRPASEPAEAPPEESSRKEGAEDQ